MSIGLDRLYSQGLNQEGEYVEAPTDFAVSSLIFGVNKINVLERHLRQTLLLSITKSDVKKGSPDGLPFFVWLVESVLDRFDLEYQLHVVTHCRQAVFHAEVGTLDLRAGCCAASVFFAHRIGAAIERIDLQRDRLADTRDGQVAVHAGGRITLEVDCGGFEADSRKFRRVKKVGSAQMFIALGKASADRGGLDGDFDRTGLGRAIQGHAAAGLVETALHGREAQMADAEMGVGVRGIYRVTVGSQGGKRQRDAEGEDSEYVLVHGRSFLGDGKSNKRLKRHRSNRGCFCKSLKNYGASSILRTPLKIGRSRVGGNPVQ